MAWLYRVRVSIICCYLYHSFVYSQQHYCQAFDEKNQEIAREQRDATKSWLLHHSRQFVTLRYRYDNCQNDNAPQLYRDGKSVACKLCVADYYNSCFAAYTLKWRTDKRSVTHVYAYHDARFYRHYLPHNLHTKHVGQPRFSTDNASVYNMAICRFAPCR